MGKKIEDKALDRIINEMVEAVENSKDEIFYIGEESRMEYEQLLADLQLTKEKVGDMIKEGDQLEQKVRYSKMRLSDVSRDFDRYSEERSGKCTSRPISCKLSCACPVKRKSFCGNAVMSSADCRGWN